MEQVKEPRMRARQVARPSVGLGSSFRLRGVSGFVEARATFVSAPLRDEWYLPVTLGLRF